MATSGMRATPKLGLRPGAGTGAPVVGRGEAADAMVRSLGAERAPGEEPPRGHHAPAAREDVNEPEAAVEDEEVRVPARLDPALASELVEVRRVGRQDPDGRFERQEAAL